MTWPVDLASEREERIADANIFWGEGCVSMRRSAPYRLRATITNTDPALLGRFRSRWGGSVSAQNRAGARVQASWQWTLTGLAACDFLDAIAPFLGGVKREAVEIGRRYRPLAGAAGQRLSDEAKAARAALALELSRLTDPLGLRGVAPLLRLAA